MISIAKYIIPIALIDKYCDDNFSFVEQQKLLLEEVNVTYYSLKFSE